MSQYTCVVQFQLEYQKKCDNTMADTLSHVTTQLDLDMVKSILDGVTLGSAHWVEVHDPAIVEADCCLEQEVCITVMHVTDREAAQKEDLMLSTVLDWLKAQKKTHLMALLAEYTSTKRDGWPYRIGRILQFIREPYTCAQHQMVKLKTIYSL